jgi:hypothetical protein
MLYHQILDEKYMSGEQKLSNFKIEGSILQNDNNRGTKTAIKPTIF